MSEGPALRRRFQFNFRRSIYGWTGAALSFVACAFLICWIVTITSARTEVPEFWFGAASVSAANGSITLCSDVGETIETMDDWAGSYASVVNEPIDYRKLDLPGFRCRVQVYEGIKTVWVLEMSIIFPFMAVCLLAAISLYRYRANCRQPISNNVGSD